MAIIFSDCQLQKLKYSKRNRLHKYDKNVVLQISIDYTKYGFDYVKIKYNLTFS